MYKWDTAKVTDMSGMFSSITANPDVSNWDTSKVTDMRQVFDKAEAANPDVSKWDTASVTDMSYMFRGTKLANPNVTKWDTAKVTKMISMFDNAAGITEISLLNKRDSVVLAKKIFRVNNKLEDLRFKNFSNAMLYGFAGEYVVENITKGTKELHVQKDTEYTKFIDNDEYHVYLCKHEVIPFPIKYVADETLEKGKQVVVTEGVVGATVAGEVTQEPTAKVIKVGVKPTVTTVGIPFDVVRRANSDVFVDAEEKVVQEGVVGLQTVTVSYILDETTGTVSAKPAIAKIVTPKVDKIIEYGTKQYPKKPDTPVVTPKPVVPENPEAPTSEPIKQKAVEKPVKASVPAEANVLAETGSSAVFVFALAILLAFAGAVTVSLRR